MSNWSVEVGVLGASVVPGCSNDNSQAFNEFISETLQKICSFVQWRSSINKGFPGDQVR